MRIKHPVRQFNRMSTIAISIIAGSFLSTSALSQGGSDAPKKETTETPKELNVDTPVPKVVDKKDEKQAAKKDGCPAPIPKCATEKAPEKFVVTFETTKGNIDIEVNRSWSPLGADRFYNLVVNGFFTDIGFFRNVPGFVVQFGIHGDPQISSQWKDAKITEDDPVKQTNDTGTLSFATAGPKTRTTQIFINFKKNDFLDKMGFSPFGKVLGNGMKIVESFDSSHGEKPVQPLIQSQGNAYLKKSFTKLDYIKSAKIKSKNQG